MASWVRRKASEIVMWILRMLHFSRAAIRSTPVTAPARGRTSRGAADCGTMISRRRFDGLFCQGTPMTGRSSSCPCPLVSSLRSVGRIHDDRGKRMSPSHARKHGIRYRYYVSSPVNEPRGDAGARLKGHVGSGLQRADGVESGKAGAHGLLGVMLMSRRVAEIDQHAIAQVLGDKSIKSRHRIGDHFVEGGDQVVHVLGVKACRQGH